MQRVFRSIINFEKDMRPTVDLSDLKKNYRLFLHSHVQPEDTAYTILYTWIEAHFREYEEVPSARLLVERATSEGHEAVLATIKEIALEQPYIGSNYKAILKEKFESQNRDKYQALLSDCWTIVLDGKKVGRKKKIQGLQDSIEHFVSESRNFRMGGVAVKTESDIRSQEDAEEIMEEYRLKKSDPLANLGMYTFLDKIDAVTRGFKPGQLIIIAGFVGQGKTTVAANIAYNGIMQGLNGLFLCMEMSFEEMRHMFYVLHANNSMWMEHPKYKHLVGKVTYDKVQYGELKDMEEEFFEAVVQDFVDKEGKQGYGHLFLKQPTKKLTPAQLENSCYDYNAVCAEEDKTLDFCVADYIGLMTQNKEDSYRDFRVDLNNIIKSMKTLSLIFDNGRGLRMITPYQTNRTGFKEAQKNDGLYHLAALSDANEAERTADLIMSVYASDEMKKNGLMKIGCMKHRKGADFPLFDARMDFPTRQLRDIIQTEAEDDELMKEIPVDA